MIVLDRASIFDMQAQHSMLPDDLKKITRLQGVHFFMIVCMSALIIQTCFSNVDKR